MKGPHSIFPSPSPRDFKPPFHQNGEAVRRLIVCPLPQIDFEKGTKFEDQKKSGIVEESKRWTGSILVASSSTSTWQTVIAAQFEWHLAGCSYHYKFPWSPAILHCYHRWEFHVSSWKGYIPHCTPWHTCYHRNSSLLECSAQASECHQRDWLEDRILSLSKIEKIFIMRVKGKVKFTRIYKLFAWEDQSRKLEGAMTREYCFFRSNLCQSRLYRPIHKMQSCRVMKILSGSTH